MDGEPLCSTSRNQTVLWKSPATGLLNVVSWWICCSLLATVSSWEFVHRHNKDFCSFHCWWVDECTCACVVAAAARWFSCCWLSLTNKPKLCTYGQTHTHSSVRHWCMSCLVYCSLTCHWPCTDTDWQQLLIHCVVVTVTDSVVTNTWLSI